MTTNKIISVISGDGIGPEITSAALRVLDALDCGLQYEFAEAGLAALEKHGDLLPQSTVESIRRNGAALKGPLTTPVGKGFRSINVTLRERFDLYANVRPVLSIPDAIARVLEKHYHANADNQKSSSRNNLLGSMCPECGETISFEEGCQICHFCGYTKCG